MPPLVVPVLDEEVEPKKKRRRRERARRRIGMDWDRRPEANARTSSFSKARMFGVLVAGVLILGLVVVWLSNTLSQRAPAPIILRQEVQPDLPKEEVVGEYAPYTETGFFEAAELLMEKFLNAKSVEEILPLVRHPEITEPRLRELYPDGKVDAPGMEEFNVGWNVQRKGRFVVVNVATHAKQVKPVAIELLPDGLKIDWECWHGWSEMTWDEFSLNKPTSGQMFRVLLAPVDYYNFDFTDDRSWQSYQLYSPDRSHALYGYVRRGSALEKELSSLSSQGGSLCVLMLSFPEGAKMPNQVIIEKLVTIGWIIDNLE